MSNSLKAVALERRLEKCRNVITLGVRTNFDDYDDEAAELIRTSAKIYYPTVFYADLFDAAGKQTFPSYHTYKCVQDKIKQTALFQLLKIPHPRTRVFYGKHQKKAITRHFKFPFIAKIPRGSAMGRGVWLIKNEVQLQSYCQEPFPAYIQEYLPADRDIRVVVIGQQCVHAYQRIAPAGDFRSNVAVGGTIDLSPPPDEAVELAVRAAQACQWDDVGIDIIRYDKACYVLEANMKYGKEGFRAAGIDYIQLMEKLIDDGKI
ncbi:ATP-grasp domain-containing protein [Desulfococcaceae bacterium HSG7]|nr:ATP-grasp domain-containing protein [Desulfococcaceae bacterium HSG7]